MPRLEQRKENILDFIVRDFIETAVPVPSVKMSKKGAMHASSATVRNIMMELDEEGFLEQPHTSAGRIPTDKGYRYFVEYLMGWQRPPAHIQHFFETRDDPNNEFFDEMSKMISRHLRLLSIVATPRHHQFLQHGFSEVLKNPEFHESRAAVSFAKKVEALEDAIDTLSSNSPEPEISIEEFGMVRTSCTNPTWGECTIISLGPKRMNYEEARSILRYAKEKLDNTKHHG